MRVLTVMFGGVDLRYLEQFDCRNLKQAQHGPVQVDRLWQDRDVSTQITSQLVTGRDWRESGVTGRKRYTDPRVEWLEKSLIRPRTYGSPVPLLHGLEVRTRPLREGLYRTLWPGVEKRNYLREDLTAPTLFEKIPDSEALYVPAYNPEPSWALGRNILDPRRLPEFGEAGAVDLAEKNFAWRARKFREAMAGDPRQFLMAQFQILDSYQHLYLVYADEPDLERVEEIYRRIDAFAGEILELAAGTYDLVLFCSENGAANTLPGRTHYDRAFYSLSEPMDLDGRTNVRDFHDHVLAWVQAPPNPVRLARDAAGPDGTRPSVAIPLE
jgi:hypothetical protein